MLQSYIYSQPSYKTFSRVSDESKRKPWRKGTTACYIWDEEFKYYDCSLVIDRKTKRNCMRNLSTKREKIEIIARTVISYYDE